MYNWEIIFAESLSLRKQDRSRLSGCGPRKRAQLKSIGGRYGLRIIRMPVLFWAQERCGFVGGEKKVRFSVGGVPITLLFVHILQVFKLNMYKLIEMNYNWVQSSTTEQHQLRTMFKDDIAAWVIFTLPHCTSCCLSLILEHNLHCRKLLLSPKLNNI